jgi:hypothetical protein
MKRNHCAGGWAQRRRVGGMSIVTFFLNFLLLCPYVSVSSFASQCRRSILRPWGEGGPDLGWCQERRKHKEDLLEISIGFGEDKGQQSLQSNDSVLHLSLPDRGEEGGLSTQLWPSSIAAAILFRSPNFQQVVEGKKMLELGSGLGLAGFVAGASEKAQSCTLTDMDQEAVDFLEKTAEMNREVLNAEIYSKVLDWRDSHGDDDSDIDVIVGADIAYYFYLLRPIMDTIKALLPNYKGLTLVLGQANRESQWDLYRNIRDGCYNQLTDEQEPPWPGTTIMLLYKLEMSKWVDNPSDFDSSIDGIVPVSLLIHHSEDTNFPNLTEFDHVATEADDESIMKTF